MILSNLFYWYNDTRSKYVFIVFCNPLELLTSPQKQQFINSNDFHRRKNINLVKKRGFTKKKQRKFKHVPPRQ